ncbi:hypothetical protein ACQUW5_00600 [Legionella sp. CNM-1927-20]|uniref:hypothetical protein n=1 Tax=Legionella sp. CNM-1927-20 TaxID=3422221 RepID=UPI00403AC236
MNKGYIIGITLLSTSMVFAAAGTSTTTTTVDPATGNTTESTTTNVDGSTTSTTPSTTTVDPTTGTSVQSTTTNVDGSTTSVTTPADAQVVDTTVNPNMEATTPVDIDNNIQIVNDRVSIIGLTTAPTFTTVEFRDGVYYLPPTITPINGFYFLTIGETERVCTVKKIKKLKVRKISPTTTKVMIRNKKVTLYCYDRTYFNF